MRLTPRLAAIAVGALLLTGCATSAAEPAGTAAPVASEAAPAPSHTMPDGTVMTGAEHGAHGSAAAAEPSHAATMVCGGQVETAIASMLGLDDPAAPTSTWVAPTFTCTYDVDGAPLVLTVHDATDVAEGEAHFAAEQARLGADEIEGMLGLGLPSFSTGDGVVGFLRDGKTLLVDATRLPATLAGGSMTPDGAAYAAASAVLVCWVDHD